MKAFLRRFRFLTGLPAVLLAVLLAVLPLLVFLPAQTASAEPVLPSSLETIGEQAFMGDSGITALILPDGVRTIQSEAFAQSALREITLPDSLTFIADDAFSGCEGLSIHASESSYAYAWAVRNGYIKINSAPESDFETEQFYDGVMITKYTGSGGYVIVPEKIGDMDVTGIGYCAFSESAVTAVILPETVHTIDQQAFHNCASLGCVVMPKSLRSLGSWVFAQCSSLVTVSIPDGVTGIGSCLFYNCSSLKQIEIPEGITSVGDWAFAGCGSLTEIILPDTVTSLGERAFSWCNQMTVFGMSDNVVSIGNYAFDGCSSLRRINLPSKLTSLGEGAFTYCGLLSSVTIPEGVEEIRAETFNNCRVLLTVSLPSTLRSIGSRAFADIASSLVFSGTMPAISDDAFSGGRFMIWYPVGTPGWSTGSLFGAKSILWMNDAQTQTLPDDDRDLTEPLVVTETDNAGDNDYATWANPVNSYLVFGSDGSFTRVEYTGSNVIVEEYSSDKTLTWKKTITPELPVWGGFFEGKDYYFLAYGQQNREEDDSREVVRIVKYSKNWNRISHCSARGANTVGPFDAGSVHFSQSGDILYLFTCHTMYTTPDGLNHQANMSFEVYIPSMEFIHENFEIGGEAYEYVSHSFNQLLLIEGSDIIKVDHGDAYPRAVRLIKVTGSAGSIAVGEISEAVMLPISGQTGDNYTGVSVGGLEASGSVYMVAGNSVDQDSASSSQRNIFVSTVNKNNVNSGSVRLIWITRYAEGSGIRVSTPQLVKISANRFLLLWNEGARVKYVFLNGSGDPVTDIFSASGSLSDCQPVVRGNSAVWYVTNGSAMVMYSVSLSSPYTLTVN